jgi:bacterioferritin-associated ferredoxin
MEPIYSYVIELDPRTKKNHQMIAGTGAKCPVCRKPAKQFIRQGAANTEFAFRAAKYIQPLPPAPITEPVRLVYKLYMGTRRKVDDLNLYAALDDILVQQKVLADDNVKVIRSRDESRVYYDKEHPRAEIYIYPMEQEEENGF